MTLPVAHAELDAGARPRSRRRTRAASGSEKARSGVGEQRERQRRRRAERGEQRSRRALAHAAAAASVARAALARAGARSRRRSAVAAGMVEIRVQSTGVLCGRHARACRLQEHEQVTDDPRGARRRRVRSPRRRPLPRPRTRASLAKSATDCGDPVLTPAVQPLARRQPLQAGRGRRLRGRRRRLDAHGGAHVVDRQRDAACGRRGDSFAAAAGRLERDVRAGLRRPQRADPALLRAQEQRPALDADGVRPGPARARRRGSRCRSASTSAAAWHPSLAVVLVVANLLPAAAAGHDRGALHVRAAARRRLADRRRLRRSAEPSRKPYRPGG